MSSNERPEKIVFSVRFVNREKKNYPQMTQINADERG